MMYYYKRKSSPFKWVIIVLIFMALGALAYWFYFNYFSRIELNKPQDDNLNLANINTPEILKAEINSISNDVQIVINQKDYIKASEQTFLHPGDKIKTGENSLAVIDLSDGSKIRLGANTEIMVQNLDRKNIIMELLKGRIYNNVIAGGQYQVKSLQGLLTALGTKFDVATNDILQTITVTVIENKVKCEITDQDDVILSSRLDTNERGLVNLKSAKKDMLKIESFDPKALAKEQWYKWNFDLDQGLADNPPDQEPDFQEISDSLNLTAVENDQGINLTWTPYASDNFLSYKIMWSATDMNLKYPVSEIVKSFADKTVIAYLDAKIEPNKKYYYRICVVKTSNKVVCGNVVELQTAIKDATAPTVPSLSATISVQGVSLTWTANSEDDFKEYRILKSLTVQNLASPITGYLVKKLKGSETYLDTEVNITYPFNVYYRVCSLDTAMNFSCSNVITVENGAIK
jgi:hypothetical protein